MHNRRLISSALAGLALFISPSVRAAQDNAPVFVDPDSGQKVRANTNTGETPEQFGKRTEWWRDAKFGMFIHWGIYAVPADATTRDGRHAIAEWYFSNKQMQMPEYEKFAKQFNPVNFNARQWVKTAKDAGMKYIVITSKHHDGFGLWDSKVSNWDIVDATPYKKDILKELSRECKRQGIRLCFYHSIMDWHHPDYLPRRPWEKETRPAAGADFNRYIGYMKAQLKELISRYDPGILWFDGEWESTWTHEMGEDLYKYVKSLKPDILINNRVDKGRAGMQGMTTSAKFYGDFGTPEQEVPPTGFDDGRLWESCMTMNDTWGYARNDNKWKSATQLIHTLIDIAHKGGNFLLNVGPTEKGEFTPETYDRLAKMGQWMKANGKSIYGTTASPFKKLSFKGRATRKGNTLYLHVFDWPGDGLRLSGLKTPVREARILATGEKLNTFAAAGKDVDVPDVLAIATPKSTLDPYATVVELKLEGPPVVIEPAVAVRANNGIFTLKAADAAVKGESLRFEEGGGKDNLGFWTNAADSASWEVDVARPGKYRVEVIYACPQDNAGSEYRVTLDNGTRVAGEVGPTNAWTDFRSVFIGDVDLLAGRRTVTIQATSIPRGACMNLKSIRLVPVS